MDWLHFSCAFGDEQRGRQVCHQIVPVSGVIGRVCKGDVDVQAIHM